MTYQFPDTVTIATPMYTPQLRGVQARGPHALGTLGDNIRVRISRHDLKTIKYVCDELLDMKRAEYFRWCGLRVADQLIEYHRQATTLGNNK